jgi:co-chaperonin GroES (HSP10)
MRPADYNVFIKDVSRNRQALEGTVTAVGKKMTGIDIGDKIYFQKGKGVQIEVDGTPCVTVSKSFVLFWQTTEKQ